MTATEKKEFREMINDLKEHINEVRNLENEAIMKELATIKELQRYSNGTQNKHTDQISELQKSLPHTIDKCPQREVINQLSEYIVIAKGIKGWKTAALASMGILIGIVVGLLSVYVAIIKN